MSRDKICPAPEVHLLGEIVVAFGNLELTLEIAIWKLLAPEGDNERFIMAQAITAEMAFRQKVYALTSMFREKRIAEADAELKELTKKLFKAEEERNQLLHSSWDYHKALGGDFFRMKASAKPKKGLRRRFHRMPPERIKKTLDRIAAASQSLMSFGIRYIPAIKPTPGTD